MSVTFDEQYAVASKLIDRINLLPAMRAAETLVGTFPTKAKGYFLLNLVGSLCGLFDPDLIDEAQLNCPDFTPTLAGDMQRDHLIGIARYGDRPDFEFAHKMLVPEIKRAHEHDLNRLALLEGALGQLAYGQRHYEQSIEHHIQASALWASMGDRADKGGIKLNMVYWLRVAVVLQGRQSAVVRELTELLKSTERSQPAKLICFPVVGVRVYDWLHQHRTLPLPL